MLKYLKGGPTLTITKAEPMKISIEREYLITFITKEFIKRTEYSKEEMSQDYALATLKECLISYCNDIDTTLQGK